MNAHSLVANTTGHIVLQKSTNVQVEVFINVEVFNQICSKSRHSIFSVPLTVFDSLR